MVPPNDICIRPEEELLLFCVRTVIDGGIADRVQTLLRQDLDWHYLVQTALHHRVIPLLYRSLIQLCPGSTPKGTLRELQHRYRANTRRNLYVAAELIKLIDWLETHGITAIPYKGPVIAIVAYGNLSLRQFGDLDILVHQRDYLRTRNLLLAHTYRLAADWGWECSLIHDTHRICIDLHRGITSEKFPVRLPFERFHKRLEQVSIAGGKINTFCAEDMLIILCIQLAKDGWGERPFITLSKVCDIADLLRARPNLNWEQVIKEARRLGCQRILFLGLSVAHELLGAPVPELFASSHAHPRLNVLSTHIYHRLCHKADCSQPGHLSSAHFHFQVRERWRDKIYPQYYSFKQRMIPNGKDRAWLAVPESLSFLYYIIRPIRLAKDYGLHVYQVFKTKLFTLNNRR